MTTHRSADARTALIATYVARYANPQAGMRFTRATPYSPQPRVLDADEGKAGPEEVFFGPFEARGRTIYNADAYPKEGTTQGDERGKRGALRELERIDEDEERRRQHWGQFLMAARGDFEECSSSGEATPTDPSGAEEMAAEEMFALYIRDV